MRITGGATRGFTLKVPKISDIRPAQEQVRLAVFSILGEEIQGAKVLDLYAGSGSFGLESLSRGAEHATFVDSNPLAIEAIEHNMKNARYWGKGEAIRHDAVKFLADSHDSFDIIFVCPPYAYGLPKPLFYQLADHLNPDGVIIFDHAKTATFGRNLEGLEIVDQRSYGATGVTFFRHKGAGEQAVGESSPDEQPANE
jgi:16S rRNA (guanine966-N2)-methyltransferase